MLAREGTLDAELRESLATAVISVKDLPGFRRYWQQRRSFFQESFSAGIDELMARDANVKHDSYRRIREKISEQNSNGKE